MSILKFTNGKNSGNESLKQAIEYILNPEKTDDTLISGNGINTKTAYSDMETIQRLFGKNSGRRYIHYIISFDKDVSEEMAFTIAEEASLYFANEYQYIFSVHKNTDNLHAHIILNTVNIQTGKKFSQSKADMLEFRDFINNCLAIHGLNLIGQSDDSTLSWETGEVEEDWEDILKEDDEIENHCGSYSFFGFADPDEISQIQYAQIEDKRMHKIIRFFEGEAEELPPDTYYNDAELEYLKWKNEQKWIDENEDENSFF